MNNADFLSQAKKKIFINSAVMISLLLAVLICILFSIRSSASEQTSISLWLQLSAIIIIFIMILYLTGRPRFPFLRVIPKYTFLYNISTELIEVWGPAQTVDWLYKAWFPKRWRLILLPINLEYKLFGLDIIGKSFSFRVYFKVRETLSLEILEKLIAYCGLKNVGKRLLPPDEICKKLYGWTQAWRPVLTTQAEFDALIKANFEEYFKNTPIRIYKAKLLTFGGKSLADLSEKTLS